MEKNGRIPPAETNGRIPPATGAVVVAIEAFDAAASERIRAALARDDRLAVADAADSAAVTVLACGTPDEQASATCRLRAGAPTMRIVVVVDDHHRAARLQRALKAGADGVVFERDVQAVLATAVLDVCAGQISIPHELRNHVTRQPLSHRERQVLRMVVMGCTNRQIANGLFLAESTVKSHLSSAFAKLNARSRSEAASLILDPDEGLGTGILGPSTGALPDVVLRGSSGGAADTAGGVRRR